jgi:CubicO group peptidase (beta-lactamase class C family)
MLLTQGKIECTPSEVQYDGSRIELLNNHLQGLIDAGEIQCAQYCLTRNGKVFAYNAIGPISYKDDKTPLLPDSIQNIASVTKIFAAAAMMKIVEDGLVRPDDLVGDIIPQFNTPPFNTINIFHLLTHTSGLHPDTGPLGNKYEFSSYDMIEVAHNKHNPEDGEFDWIAAALGQGMRKKPGEEWMYCSFGINICGAIIEKLTGVKARKYIEDNILKPLGMKDSGFDLTPEQAKRAIISAEWSWREEEINRIINGKPEPAEGRPWANIPHISGAMNSTSFDLTRFGNMMLGNGTFNGVRILGRKSVEKMTTVSIHNVPNYGWGANEPDRSFGIGVDMRKGPGWSYSPGTFGHEGAGFSSLIMDPVENLCAAWIVPFAKEGWFPRALWNVQNIIWSGLK